VAFGGREDSATINATKHTTRRRIGGWKAAIVDEDAVKGIMNSKFQKASSFHVDH
jgi:hypothetical protein